MNQQTWLKVGAGVVVLFGFFFIFGVAFAQNDAIEGEEWIVQELRVDSALVAPLPGPVMAAVFDEGTLHGIGGCNSFFAAYELDGDSIDVGPIGATRMFCTEPEGIMDQEGAYFAALGEADRYERDGDSLTLFSDDAAVIVFETAKSELGKDA